MDSAYCFAPGFRTPSKPAVRLSLLMGRSIQWRRRLHLRGSATFFVLREMGVGTTSQVPQVLTCYVLLGFLCEALPNSCAALWTQIFYISAGSSFFQKGGPFILVTLSNYASVLGVPEKESAKEKKSVPQEPQQAGKQLRKGAMNPNSFQSPPKKPSRYSKRALRALDL